MQFKTKRSRRELMSEINVTPFVDVMLVLLIIFMITAPLLTTAITVDLPSTESKALPGQDEPITITITSDENIFIGENHIKKEALLVTLNSITGIEKESRIFDLVSSSLIGLKLPFNFFTELSLFTPTIR